MNHVSTLSLLSDLLVVFRLVITITFKHFRHSNFLCARVFRTITNHTSIGEYCLRFFPKESSACFYDEYLIEIRNYITYKCRRFNNYYNPNNESLENFITFLEFNPGVFSFHKGIT